MLPPDSPLKKEMVLTSQEGKLYYVAQYNYFVDLADIDDEFTRAGHYEDLQKRDAREEVENLINVRIP